jgi:hypothetical protein
MTGYAICSLLLAFLLADRALNEHQNWQLLLDSRAISQRSALHKDNYSASFGLGLCSRNEGRRAKCRHEPEQNFVLGAARPQPMLP